MLYIDTSVLVAALTVETETTRMQGWLASQSDQELAVSDWTITEFSSALSIKLRTGQLQIGGRNSALSAFGRVVAESFETLPVNGLHFRSAARLADRHELGLRAGDALHLAIAIEHGVRVCTLDRLLAEGGASVGADTWLL